MVCGLWFFHFLVLVYIHTPNCLLLLIIMELASAVDSAVAAGLEAIEIVPDVLFPSEDEMIVESKVLGIRYKALYKRYVELSKRNQQFTPSALLITILATPENVTAWNRRKDLCIEGGIAKAKAEWKLITIILQSHLEKLCKSPLAWYHRKWLLKTFGPEVCELVHNADSTEGKCDDELIRLHTEFNLVKVATEHHRCNYAAWGYLRWFILQMSPAKTSAGTGEYNKPGSTYKESKALQEFQGPILEPVIKAEIVRLLEKMCVQHVSDCSVWSFVFWLNEPQLYTLAETLNQKLPGHQALAYPLAIHTSKFS